MTDLTTYFVLGLVILPPILRQGQRLFSAASSSRRTDAQQAPRARLFSSDRLTPFASPFSTAVTVTALGLILVSLRNLIPAHYGIDIFVPASAIQGLRRSLAMLYAGSKVFGMDDIDSAHLHVEAFRGGYKPDLFLSYKAPITIPTTTLRSLISHAPALLPLGYLTDYKQVELQALIARLSSYEARRMYLLLGPRPLLDCTFCKTANDYFYYAVPFLFSTYAWRALALGLLTTHPDDSIAVAIRQAAQLVGLSSRRELQDSQNGHTRAYEADRSGRRTVSLIVLLGLLAIELLVMFEFGQVTAQPSRLNHWHSNLHILRQLVFLALVLAIYLSPAPRVVDRFQQIMLRLEATQQSLQNIVHVNELADVARNVVLHDDQLLESARQSKSDSHQGSGIEVGPWNADKIVQLARAQGGPAADEAIAQARGGIRTVTRRWWQNAELANQELDQRGSLEATLSDASQQSTPQPSTSDAHLKSSPASVPEQDGKPGE